MVDSGAFRKAFNVRNVERCCGTCRHFDRRFEDSGCANPKQAEFDPEEQEARKDPDYVPERYGALNGIIVDEGCICDLWEKIPKPTPVP